MGRLDHGDVVGPVTDGQRHGLLVPLDQINYLSLLERGDTTTDDCHAHGGDLQECPLQPLTQGEGQGVAVDDKGHSSLSIAFRRRRRLVGG